MIIGYIVPVVVVALAVMRYHPFGNAVTLVELTVQVELEPAICWVTDPSPVRLKVIVCQLFELT